ncbi:MAG: hypothetical protein ABMA64_20640 [Myxococcota bacterium]
MARRPLLIGLLALLPAGLALGVGPMNGDAAAYATSPVTDRWVHAAYAAVGQLAGFHLVNLAAAGLAVAAAAHHTRRALPTLAAAAVVVAWAPFAEVDLPWAALVVAATVVHPALLGLAVLTSPTALLAAPWVVARSERPNAAVAAVAALAAVAAVTLASGGQWWVGERGVLHPGPLMPGLGFGRLLLHLPWLLVLADPRGLRGLAWLAPLVFAPTDTPAWLVPAWAIACEARAPRPAVAATLVGGWLALADRAWQISGENAVIARVVAELGPEDGLVAPWTWGARAAVAASGDPYGIRWHPPGRFLRAQASRWCRSPPQRIHHLPPTDAPRPDSARCPPVTKPPPD